MPRQVAPQARWLRKRVGAKPSPEGLATEFSAFHSSCQLDLKEQLLFAHFPSKQISSILCYRVAEIVHVWCVSGVGVGVPVVPVPVPVPVPVVPVPVVVVVVVVVVVYQGSKLNPSFHSERSLCTWDFL